MNLTDTCPFCGAGDFKVFDGQKGWKKTWVAFACHTLIFKDRDLSLNQSNQCIARERARLAARVAGLEARTREAEESNANALARHSAAEARIELRRIENEAVRHQVWHAENVCDAMEKRVLDLEARCKRLEEAARAVYLDSIASDHPWTELETRNMHALRDVLEAKP